MQRHQSKILKLLGSTGRSAAEKNHASSEISEDIYGYREGNYYKYGPAESVDFENFNMKIEPLKCQLEALRPGFHVWFLSKRRTIFIDSVIQSSRQSTDIEG